MRVTNTLFYSTSVTEHQSAMKKLYDIDKQLASGMKIQNRVFDITGFFKDRVDAQSSKIEQFELDGTIEVR